MWQGLGLEAWWRLEEADVHVVSGEYGCPGILKNRREAYELRGNQRTEIVPI